jgi:hypothetical protein
MTVDPLQELLLDQKDVDRAILARALKDILGIDKTTGLIVLKPSFGSLTAIQKVLAYLLGRKVSFLLGKSESEMVSVKDVIRDTGLPRGTVAPKLRTLFEKRLVSQMGSGGEYYVSAHQILPAISKIQREEEDEIT